MRFRVKRSWTRAIISAAKELLALAGTLSGLVGFVGLAWPRLLGALISRILGFNVVAWFDRVAMLGMVALIVIGITVSRRSVISR